MKIKNKKNYNTAQTTAKPAELSSCNQKKLLIYLQGSDRSRYKSQQIPQGTEDRRNEWKEMLRQKRNLGEQDKRGWDGWLEG